MALFYRNMVFAFVAAMAITGLARAQKENAYESQKSEKIKLEKQETQAEKKKSHLS